MTKNSKKKLKHITIKKTNFDKNTIMTIYNNVKERGYNIDDGLRYAKDRNIKDIFEHLIKNGADYKIIMSCYGCCNYTLQFFEKFLINKESLNFTMKYVYDIETLKFLIDRGADDLENVFEDVDFNEFKKGEILPFIQLVIENGYKNYGKILYMICDSFLHKNEYYNYEESTEKIEILEYMLKLEVDNLYKCLYILVNKELSYMVQLIVPKHYKKNLNDFLKLSVENMDLETSEILISNGAVMSKDILNTYLEKHDIDIEFYNLLTNKPLKITKKYTKIKNILNTLDIKSLCVAEKYLCPISREIMKDPVIIASGRIYDREEIETWLIVNNTDPETREILEHREITSCIFVQNEILDFLTNL